ncbi:hypothetical protein PsorP6_003188 [Peronosclerospora sorghi]|uniref:Uncharacterized protein n=1 Tax=Peronosclerospora sorghi TaxID=230839 RepID=A0ACC0VIF1_9STRA|nr:hypothetical protein PsorP6_003188 [Peronosclerospora sorghi]
MYCRSDEHRHEVDNMFDQLVGPERVALGDVDDFDDSIPVSALSGDDDGVDGLLNAMLESAAANAFDNSP